VELMYQTIGYRWANNLGQLSSPEIDRFVEMEKAMTNPPIVVDRAVSEVEG
jgi:hypothetical protein